MSSRKLNSALLLSAALCLGVGAGEALAAPAVGLVDDATLVMFDTDNPTVTKKMTLQGVGRLAGVDLRPANKTLIAVSEKSEVFVVDLTLGAAKKLSTMDKPLPMTDAPVIVDFNPKANKLRFMTGATNHRVDVDSGKVTVDGSLSFENKDMHAGETPNIVAAAYANSYGKPNKTAMYDVDATIVALIRQTSPNDGSLAAIGKLGIDGASHYAFDIQTTKDGKDTAWLAADNALYKVDLKSGAARKAGEIAKSGGVVRDIAILPID